MPISHDFDKDSNYYITQFYSYARGHILNKFHICFWGDYVDEAIKIMEMNSDVDKKNINTQKKFKNKSIVKYLFNDWKSIFYNTEKNPHILCMFWNATSVTIPGTKANVEQKFGMDSTKSMKYPIINGHQTENLQLTIKFVDDPYMMWWHFFNALFNCQFSPLILKPRSTFHKINCGIDVLGDRPWVEKGCNNETDDKNYKHITDLDILQMFEFNSIVLENVPDVIPDNDAQNPATYTLTFKLPNAFQGSFNVSDRGLADNTTLGINGTSSTDDATDKNTLYKQDGNQKYNVNFFENEATKLPNQVGEFNALNVKDYNSWKLKNQ